MRAIMLVLAAVPAALALAVMLPMLQPGTPAGSTTPFDALHLEYLWHEMNGSELVRGNFLRIGSDGSTTLTITRGAQQSDVEFMVPRQEMMRLTAFVKETGLVSIPDMSIPLRDDARTYQRSVASITLNDQQKRLSWHDADSADGFVPPVLIQLDMELKNVTAKYSNNYQGASTP